MGLIHVPSLHANLNSFFKFVHLCVFMTEIKKKVYEYELVLLSTNLHTLL